MAACRGRFSNRNRALGEALASLAVVLNDRQLPSDFPVGGPRVLSGRPEKLTIEEVERRYRDEWVLIVDYDFEFPRMKLTAGFVRAHGAGRAALQPLAQNFRRCAIHWTGPIHDPLRYWRSRVVHAV